MTKTVTIYTDGACSGNPGPGGWGAILCYKGVEKELSGGAAQTTNNRMELTGVISALEQLKEPCAVELYSDSKYAGKGLGKVMAEPGLEKGGQKACLEPGPLGAAACALRYAHRPLPLGEGARGK